MQGMNLKMTCNICLAAGGLIFTEDGGGITLAREIERLLLQGSEARRKNEAIKQEGRREQQRMYCMQPERRGCGDGGGIGAGERRGRPTAETETIDWVPDGPFLTFSPRPKNHPPSCRSSSWAERSPISSLKRKPTVICLSIERILVFFCFLGEKCRIFCFRTKCLRKNEN
uniref:Uncharacterized protein n=1 Tax=Oryza glaberrima TaxID=4538 RepID=I1NJL3_ORYGL